MVKDGYKKTEIGLIPNDWEVNSIGNIFEFKNGLNKAKEFFGYGMPIVNYMDVFKHYGLTVNDIIGKADVTREELNAYNVKKGDVFFTRTSETVDEIGITTVILEDVKDTVFSGFILRARPINNDLDINYKKYCFSLKNIRTQIISTTSYTTRALTNGNSLSKVQIPIPPKEEQKAIAKALGDTDELISSLKKLIVKKEAMKQGTMQQLLTGKKRLSGFSGEWEEKRLGEIATFFKGKGLPKSHLSLDGKYKCIHYGELFTTYKEIVNNIQNFTNHYKDVILSIENDILMPTSDVTPNGLATASCIQENGIIMGGDILIIRPNKNILDGRFFAFYISIDKNQIMQLISGSTVYHLYSSDMSKFTFKIPSTLEEQNAISQILADMDNEIETLKSQLSKTKAIKDGIMNELLTGKTRLLAGEKNEYS